METLSSNMLLLVAVVCTFAGIGYLLFGLLLWMALWHKANCRGPVWEFDRKSLKHVKGDPPEQHVWWFWALLVVWPLMLLVLAIIQARWEWQRKQKAKAAATS